MQFQQDWPKDKKITALSIFWLKTETFRTTQLYRAPVEGSTIFLNRSSTCRMSMESYRLAEFKYAFFFSMTGRKTKKLPRSKLFLWMVFNPIQDRGHFVPPPSPASQHISKTACSLELLLGEFSFYAYCFQKSSVPPISPHVCCHGNHATFWLIFENSKLDCFSSISA